MSDVLKELGIEPVINATGPWTMMGNSSLSPGVTEAMEAAAQTFILLSFDGGYPTDFAKSVSAHPLASSPRIFVAERENNTLCIGAECLKASDAQRAGQALRNTMVALGKR